AVNLFAGKEAQAAFPLTYPDFAHMREQPRSLSGLASFSMINTMALTGTGKPERIWGSLASANYFDVLGVKPILGRTFLPQEDQTGAAPVAVISYALWQTHFGGASKILGHAISVNRNAFTAGGE